MVVASDGRLEGLQLAQQLAQTALAWRRVAFCSTVCRLFCKYSNNSMNISGEGWEKMG